MRRASPGTASWPGTATYPPPCAGAWWWPRPRSARASRWAPASSCGPRAAGPGAGFVEDLIFLPFLLPPIITGLSLLVFFPNADLDRGPLTTIIGHAAFLLAVAYILTRLAALPRSLVEASYDLGAKGWQTFRHVLWPHLATALITAGLLAFTLSLNETPITVFLAGDTMTLPLRLRAMMRVGFTPEVNALVTLGLVVTSLVTLALSWRLRRRGEFALEN